jgi:putative endonuclease
MKNLGDHYEKLALVLLRDAGMHLVARNYRCKPGEIDIIARDHGTLVFIEVRARSSTRFATAAASVDGRKQRRLRLAALHFLQRHPQLADMPCRFDVIAFEPRQSAAAATPRWIRSAFTS